MELSEGSTVMAGPKAGTCRHCEKETGGIVMHERFCRAKLTDGDEALIERCSAHVMPDEALRAAQRYQDGVTDLDTARVMLALERGIRLYLNRANRWYAPKNSQPGLLLSPTVHEMIRTGILRHWRDRNGDHLVPAKVHLEGERYRSVCHFAGEGLGPMRARITRNLALVDCLECLDAL